MTTYDLTKSSFQVLVRVTEECEEGRESQLITFQKAFKSECMNENLFAYIFMHIMYIYLSFVCNDVISKI